VNTINQNINNNYYPEKIQFKAGTLPDWEAGSMPENISYQDAELPDMYYMPENYKKNKTFAEKIKKVDIMGLVHPWFEHPLLMIATCFGLSAGIDAFDKSCNKTYEKSIVGKAAKFGDKIEQSNFVKNDTTQNILKNVKKGWVKVKNTALKNDVVYSMFKTPSEPEWNIPKDELKHTNYRIVTKFKELASAFNMVPEAVSGGNTQKRVFQIKDLALDKSEIENLKKIYNVEKISMIPEDNVVNRIMLQRLGKSETEISAILPKSNASDIVAEEIFKKSGLTKAELQAIFKDETGETFELVKKASGNLRGVRLAHGKIVLPGPRQPFANIEGFEGIYNRAYSLSDGAATKTGRFMSKLVQKIYRGLTFGNQKQAVLIWVAPFLVGSIINTIRADKKEKIGTAVSGIINAFSWVFTFPIALRAIHAFGGIQYAGMGKEKVDEYKKLVKEFNEKVNSKEFKDISEYKTAKKALKQQLKNLRKVDNQNLLTITLRDISKFSKADLLKLESFKNGTSGDFIRRLPNLLKDYLVYAPGRMLVFMFAGIAIADKIIDKSLSLIFGKPYDGFKDDEMKDSKNKQEEATINDLRNRLLDIQKEKINPKQEPINQTETIDLKEAQIPPRMAELSELAERNISNTSIDDTQSDLIKSDSEDIASDEVSAAETEKADSSNSFEENSLSKKDEETENIKNSEQKDITEEEGKKDSTENQTNLDNSGEEPETLIYPEINEESNPNLNEDPNSASANEITPDNNTGKKDNMPTEKAEDNLDNEIPQDNENINRTPSNSGINSIPSNTFTTAKLDNYTYIPSQDSVFNNSNPAQQVYKYIPSQTGIQINKTFDNSALDKALRRAERAERQALDVLAGNFGDL